MQIFCPSHVGLLFESDGSVRVYQQFILVVYQSTTDFTANETHFSAFPSARWLARSPAPLNLLRGLGGSGRLKRRISVVPQRFIAKLVMLFPPVIIEETALYCATLRPPHEASHCHCAGQLWRHALIFPDNSAANVSPGTRPQVTGIT